MIYRSHLSKRKIKQLIDCFIFDGDEYNPKANATMTAKILKLNRKTVNRYYHIFRASIFAHQQGIKKNTSQEYKNFEKNRLMKFFGFRNYRELHEAESQWRFGKDRGLLKVELLDILGFSKKN